MKAKVNYFIDAGMLVAFLACGITGILKMPELNILIDMEMYTALSVLHDWSGVASAILIVVHFVLHARWFSVMTRTIFAPRTGINTVAETTQAAALKINAKKSAVALIAILFLVQANSGLWADRGGHFSNAAIPQGIDYKAGSLKDGTYTGTANGYQPSLTVEVEVSGGKIRDIRIVSHRETPRWYQAVVRAIPDRIIAFQSTDVDAVSGATDSSRGIMAAVENALKKAAK